MTLLSTLVPEPAHVARQRAELAQSRLEHQRAENAALRQLVGLLLADRAELGFDDGGEYVVWASTLTENTHPVQLTAGVDDDGRATVTARVEDLQADDTDDEDGDLEQDEPVRLADALEEAVDGMDGVTVVRQARA